MSWHFHTSVGKKGLSDHNHFCTRVEVSSVMTCAHFGVDILRDMGSVGVQILGSPSPLWLGLTTAARTFCCDRHVITSNVRPASSVG
jgi:hypothetical protein